jgi:GTP1/Obg family GTP-binding protein
MVHARIQYSYIILTFLSILNLALTDDRNNIERLTLAVLSYLPIAVLYVHDLSEDCGTKVADQVYLLFTSPELLMSLIYVNFQRSLS